VTPWEQYIKGKGKGPLQETYNDKITLMMEAVSSSEMTALCNIPEDSHLHLKIQLFSEFKITV
jgi:hypothetical protein